MCPQIVRPNKGSRWGHFGTSSTGEVFYSLFPDKCLSSTTDCSLWGQRHHLGTCLFSRNRATLVRKEERKYFPVQAIVNYPPKWVTSRMENNHYVRFVIQKYGSFSSMFPVALFLSSKRLREFTPSPLPPFLLSLSLPWILGLWKGTWRAAVKGKFCNHSLLSWFAQCSLC